MKGFYLFLMVCFFVACGNPQQENKNSEAVKVNEPSKQALVNKDGLKMNPKHPHIPQSDLGITVVNETGWDTSTFDFHLNYCQQMMREMSGSMNTAVFCECFLSKIQYYYPPVHFKEAYEDQKTWNQFCYEAGEQAFVE